VKYSILVMSNPQKGDFVKAPQIECKYLTSFKKYEVLASNGQGGFVILDNNHDITHCRLLKDGHLDEKDWTLIKKDELHSQP
jgi:hypothetical protein